MSKKSTVLYRTEGAVGVITLNRPEKRNAQNLDLLYQVNDAFDQAANDDDVTVVVLRAEGPDFSSGHDLLDDADLADFDHVTPWAASSCPAPRAGSPGSRRSTSASACAGATCPSPPSRSCRAGPSRPA